MQVTVEDVSSVKKILHIEIPENDTTRELEKAYSQLKKTAKIKGFRPGKAPRSVLERLFKKDVHADVTSQLIQESFVEALKETELDVIGTPKIDPPAFDEKKAYKFEATVEVRPEIDAIDFKGLALTKTMYAVSDQEVEAQIEMLRKNMARLEKIEEDRAAQAGDSVMIDYEGLKDGKPFAETQRTENFTLKLGAAKITKEFDDALVGMKPGDEKEIKIAFPEDHFNKKLAGLGIEFQVTLKEIRKEVLPEVDAEFVKKLGSYETVADLKADIVKNLTQGYQKRVEQEINEQVYTALLEKAQFEVPDSMVDYELQNIVADAERSFAYHNVNMDDLGLTKEKMEEQYRDTAIKQVKRHLILGKIIEQENMTLSDDELDKGFAEMAASFNQPVDRIKQYYQENKENLAFFKHTLLEKNAITLIVEQGTVKEVAPEPEVGQEGQDVPSA